MTRWLVYPGAQADDAYALAAAVDAELGYPREHPPEEVRRFGGGRHHEGPVRTETHCAIVRLADGRVAVQVDAVVDALSGRSVEIDVGAGPRQVAIDTSGAQSPVDLTDAVALAPRGGLELI